MLHVHSTERPSHARRLGPRSRDPSAHAPHRPSALGPRMSRLEVGRMRARSSRRRLAPRRPWVFWIAAATVASLTALVVASLVQEGERRMEEWGAGRSVPVATRELAPGTALSDSDVRWE